MKKDFVQPILALLLICLVMSAALAFTNQVTTPIIETNAQERATAARKELIPDAEDFALLNVDGLPASVTEAYETTNDVGYLFALTVKGYGGDMSIYCAIDETGHIIATKTLQHGETKGMGSKTAEEPFRSTFVGKDSALEGVSIISGATVSSEAYIGAINDAFTAFELVKGAA